VQQKRRGEESHCGCGEGSKRGEEGVRKRRIVAV